MTTQIEQGGRAAWVDEQALHAFLAGHGPSGPTTDPEMTWESELDGWGTPGSADFARSFEQFLYEIQQGQHGLIVADSIGNGPTPILMEITTDGDGVADCFLIRTYLKVGVQVTSGSEELRHLAAGEGTDAVIDAVSTVAQLVSSSYRDFVIAATSFCGNEVTSTSGVAGGPEAPLPVGTLACPACGSVELATIERGQSCGTITRQSDGEVVLSDNDDRTDFGGFASLGVECLHCVWEFLGADWDRRLVAAAV